MSWGPDNPELGIEIAKATEIGLWIEYLWPNPATGENEQKRTWAIRHDGYLFGSGYYKPVVENDMDTMGATDTASERKLNGIMVRPISCHE